MRVCNRRNLQFYCSGFNWSITEYVEGIPVRESYFSNISIVITAVVIIPPVKGWFNFLESIVYNSQKE
jgi:hypothetical protein